MELRSINVNEDTSGEIYASDGCHQVINKYVDCYPKIGFNIPWVGHFVVKQNQIVGSCGFTGQPKDGKVEIAYWTFKECEGQGIATFSCKELISIANKTDTTVLLQLKLHQNTTLLQKFCRITDLCYPR